MIKIESITSFSTCNSEDLGSLISSSTAEMLCPFFVAIKFGVSCSEK
jgi:hypothetical protein